MKHIDKVFREKLYNQKAAVPDGMWEKIAPAIEEKSARGILWFWFAGILTLLIGGLSYLLLSNYFGTNSGSPLAIESTIQKEPNQSNSISQPLAIDDSSQTETEQQIKSVEIEKIATATKTQKPRKAQTPKKKTITQQPNTNLNLKETFSDVSVSSTELKNTDNLYGKPANLVITKSYISNNGSIIEKSDLSSDSKSEPSYNVFINSEGLNAGALLRIIEPLENIPLPAFSQDLKKKIIL